MSGNPVNPVKVFSTIAKTYGFVVKGSTAKQGKYNVVFTVSGNAPRTPSNASVKLVGKYVHCETWWKGRLGEKSAAELRRTLLRFFEQVVTTNNLPPAIPANTPPPLPTLTASDKRPFFKFAKAAKVRGFRLVSDGHAVIGSYSVTLDIHFDGNLPVVHKLTMRGPGRLVELVITRKGNKSWESDLRDTHRKILDCTAALHRLTEHTKVETSRGS